MILLKINVTKEQSSVNKKRKDDRTNNEAK